MHEPGIDPQTDFRLGQNTFHRIGILHSSQALLQTLVGKSEFVVINAHAMQNSCIQFIQVHGVFSYVVTEVVGLSVSGSLFYAASGHPHAKISGMMIRP